MLGGKIEFETGEEGREREILTHLLRTATAETVRQHLRGLDFAAAGRGDRGRRAGHHRASRSPRATSSHGPAGARGVRPLRPGLDRLGATNDGERAGAIELALEGLYLARKIGKDSDGGETVYG